MINNENALEFTRKLLKPTTKGKADTELIPVNSTQDESLPMSCSPNEVLQSVLAEVYGIEDAELVHVFSCRLTEKISLLMTNGKDMDIVGTDFNALIQTFVMSLNLVGKLKKIIDDHGIELDPGII